MKPLGTQIIAEFIYCSKKTLNDKNGIEQILKRGLDGSGLNIINIIGHQFNPVGVTVMAIIGESHVAIHTYPEARHASVDIFTCSTDAQKQISKLLNFLKDKLKPKTVQVIELRRGSPLQIIKEGQL